MRRRKTRRLIRVYTVCHSLSNFYIQHRVLEGANAGVWWGKQSSDGQPLPCHTPVPGIDSGPQRWQEIYLCAWLYWLLSNLWSPKTDLFCKQWFAKTLANILLYEPGYMSYKIASASSKDFDQPAHPRSLIGVFAVRLKTTISHLCSA